MVMNFLAGNSYFDCRFLDVITQRLLMAAVRKKLVLHSKTELDDLTNHCIEAEDAADKVEPQVEKSVVALLLKPRIGDPINSIVTGASARGTWIRLLEIPAEGKLPYGRDGADVGDWFACNSFLWILTTVSLVLRR